MPQVGQCSANEQLFTEVIMASKLIYCTLLNPAFGDTATGFFTGFVIVFIMKDLPPAWSWLMLVKPCERREHHQQKQTLAFKYLFHANMPFPPAISPHSLPSLQHLWQGSSTWQPCNSGGPPEQYLPLLSTETDKAVEENNLRCIKMFLHQRSNQGHLHTLAATQLLEFTWKPQFNVQMKELGESQAKPMQISARHGRDLAGWGLPPLEKINWE